MMAMTMMMMAMTNQFKAAVIRSFRNDNHKKSCYDAEDEDQSIS